MCEITIALPKFEPKEGASIENKYRLIEILGSGGFATVWRAEHLLGGFDVAIKLFNTEQCNFELASEEFKTLSTLYHPQIVRTFDMAKIINSDYAYISMEYVKGDTLYEYIKRKNKASAQNILDWLIEIINIISTLHKSSLQVIHKDIKPSNIIISNNQLKLIDFNLSGVEEYFLGTPQYKCPYVDEEFSWMRYADIWSTALTFYELLKGKFVFEKFTSFDCELDEKVPTGFPKEVFEALVSIIKGNGRDITCDKYIDLFKLPEKTELITSIPEQIKEEFNITSRNHENLTIALLNLEDRDRGYSKPQIIREFFSEHNLPDRAVDITRLKPVFSQLNTRQVTENRKRYTAGWNIGLTKEFRDAFKNA